MVMFHADETQVSSVFKQLHRFLADRRCRTMGIALTLVLLVVAFFAAVIPIAYANVRSADWDQHEYLKIALWIAHGGDMTDSNRHPLYPALLAPFAQRDIGFFTTGKLFSIGLGGLGLLLIFWVARHYVGDVGALMVTALLMLNDEYRTAAGHVDVEVLLTPLFFAAWHASGVAARRIIENTSGAIKMAMAAGILSGLCYLAKGTGLIFPVLFGAPLLLFMGLKPLRAKAAWAFATAFVLLALPLWIHNIVHYGAPTYNIITTRCMWLDNWENSYVYDETELPTFGAYWQTHSLGDALERLWNGLTRVAPRQWYTAMRPAFLPDAPWAQWSSLAVGLIVWAGVTYRAARNWAQRGPQYVLSSLGLLAFLLLFAFYHPIGDAARFMGPWLPVVGTAAIWLCRSQERAPKYAPVGAVAGLLVCLTAAGLTLQQPEGVIFQLTTLRAHDQQTSAATTAFMEDILARTHPGERIILGPTHALAEWLTYDRDVRAIPQVRQNWPSFTTWLIEHEARVIALDRESWKRRQPLLNTYWTLTGNGLSATALPPGWTLVRPAAHPCDPCLYAFDPAPYRPENTADFAYAAQAVLAGYTLTPATLMAGTPFTLTLYWQLQQPLTETTHVFVHLLNAGGALAAQHDGPLVLPSGMAEHDQYWAGTRLRDSHPLPPLPPGVYSVRVGLYRWASQTRLTATSAHFPTPDSYPELLHFSIPE